MMVRFSCWWRRYVLQRSTPHTKCLEIILLDTSIRVEIEVWCGASSSLTDGPPKKTPPGKRRSMIRK